ncbi:acyl-CoA dehydrogenase C-terminal domain-containing protein [Variovorax sp. J22G21]|uniref:acyl-CoA dehydrogenase C-terminal domain-containing protein n=1 Tax=Variovorax fucosicus TaxID=3053517 RepID=UPI0025773881|nr:MULTISPECIES: acyl-CoA dehydrogenase C-terminal domain-containing protein [unclassified Variovorax]MDM0041245.1 acyl-CoA dehydrogenase C-terminal domain-containing protein [Variovorax sp. J22R193]MDM0060302.1 acyl-CoA dehydrogenase C-terminal domain-containing protein [Variovorax sp. J22G21]
MNYQSPLRDFQFVLHELLQVPSMMQSCGQSHFDADTIDQVLSAAGQFASEVIAPLNAAGDQHGCIMAAPGVVQTPPGFKQAYDEYSRNGWHGLACSEEFGGQGFPSVVDSAVTEMLGGANMAWSAYTGMSHATYVNVAANGSAEQKALYLPKIASGEWAGTMCLTEPNAGTDLGLLRTRAVPQPDGTYSISGTKIFISGGEQDLTENVMHLVLARMPNSPQGVKGISLFIVPKFIPDASGGVGPRNAVTCGSLEHKLGIHGNSTCTMNFDGATGWLLGEAERGLAGMFVQMNYMRVLVGVTAIGVMEAAYQKALAYAKERLQGRVAGAKPSNQGADPIAGHADVRRMLLTQKANVEGARALALWTSQLSDLQRLHPDAAKRTEAGEMLGLLTPVVKALASDLGVESTLLAMQVFGGHGYVRENGVEQHLRDVRIIGLYEGTNGVQAMDLLGRKVLGDQGHRMNAFLDMAGAFADACSPRKAMREFAEPLAQLVADVRQLTAELVSTSANDAHASGAAAVPYLRLVGHLALAWTWARMAEVSLNKPESTDPIYASKVATARFYFQRLLPQAAALRAEIRAGSSALMEPALDLL